MGRPRKFTTESVEAALDRHVPGRWTRQSGSGYRITYDDGPPLILTTLKEAFAFVQGCEALAVTP